MALVTPVLGTPTSGNLSNCTADGTDEVGFKNIPQLSKSANYTLVLTDAGKHIFHPVADNNARTFTIPAASSVAFPIGTAVTFINMAAAACTIAITTDVMNLSSAGTTGSRTLAQYGSATAIKVAGLSSSGIWLISGSGLTWVVRFRLRLWTSAGLSLLGSKPLPPLALSLGLRLRAWLRFLLLPLGEEGEGLTTPVLAEGGWDIATTILLLRVVATQLLLALAGFQSTAVLTDFEVIFILLVLLLATVVLAMEVEGHLYLRVTMAAKVEAAAVGLRVIQGRRRVPAGMLVLAVPQARAVVAAVVAVATVAVLPNMALREGVV